VGASLATRNGASGNMIHIVTDGRVAVVGRQHQRVAVDALKDTARDVDAFCALKEHNRTAFQGPARGCDKQKAHARRRKKPDECARDQGGRRGDEEREYNIVKKICDKTKTRGSHLSRRATVVHAIGR